MIMSRGRIEQIGNPQEIYRAPRTRFVAEFLGSSNIFSGSVADAGGQSVKIATQAGNSSSHPIQPRSCARGIRALSSSRTTSRPPEQRTTGRRI